MFVNTVHVGNVEILRLVLGRGPLLDGCRGGYRGGCVAPHALRAGSAVPQSISAPVAISAKPVASTRSFARTSSFERQTAREQGWMLRANGARVRVPGVGA